MKNITNVSKIYQFGCAHKSFGCTSDIYNGFFIKKWKDTKSGIEYTGMPQFDDTEDWFNNANNVKVLEMYYPNKNTKCTK